MPLTLCRRTLAQNNAFFDHLQAFSQIRRTFDQIYHEKEAAEVREQLEMFCAPNKFKLVGGERDETKRQRARDALDPSKMSDNFIAVRHSSTSPFAFQPKMKVRMLSH